MHGFHGRKVVSILLMVLSFVVASAMAGCGGGGGGGNGRIHFGNPPPSPESSVESGSGAPAPTTSSASILVYGVHVVPPTWLTLGDYGNLEVAIGEYIRDAQSALRGWTPLAGDSAQFPLRIVFHDVKGQNYWNPTTRTAWLEWPRGASTKPLREKFAPFLHEVLVNDMRREKGTSASPWSQEEVDAAVRGRNLQVTLDTYEPQMFE